MLKHVSKLLYTRTISDKYIQGSVDGKYMGMNLRIIYLLLTWVTSDILGFSSTRIIFYFSTWTADKKRYTRYTLVAFNALPYSEFLVLGAESWWSGHNDAIKLIASTITTYDTAWDNHVTTCYLSLRTSARRNPSPSRAIEVACAAPTGYKHYQLFQTP
jgi:hypothetical protein